MAFTSKNLQSHKSGMTFLKGATLFFLGMSVVMFMTQAFEIVPSVRNAKQYIQDIVFTIDGSATADTGIYLNGLSGNAYFAGTVTGAVFCLEGDSCIDTRPEGGTTVVGVESIWSTSSSGKAYYNSGNVGVKTTNPTEKFQVSDYLQIWDDGTTSLSTGWNFLRIHSTYISGSLIPWERIWIPAHTRNPNIQLNRTSAWAFPITYSNRKIENNGTLRFKYATGNYDYADKMTLNSTWLLTLDGNIKLQTGGYISSASNDNQLYLDNNGNVGIGTWTPQAKLHVAGSWHFNGNVFVNNNLWIGINPISYYKLEVDGASRFSWNITTESNIFLTRGKTKDIRILAGKWCYSWTDLNILAWGADNFDCSSNSFDWWNIIINGGPWEWTGVYGDVILANNGGKVKVGSNLKLSSTSTYGIIESSSKLWFNTSGNALLKMVIDTVGNVGIGIDSPYQRLDINGAIKIKNATTNTWCDSTNAGTLGYMSLFNWSSLVLCMKTSNTSFDWVTVVNMSWWLILPPNTWTVIFESTDWIW